MHKIIVEHVKYIPARGSNPIPARCKLGADRNIYPIASNLAVRLKEEGVECAPIYYIVVSPDNTYDTLKLHLGRLSVIHPSELPDTHQAVMQFIHEYGGTF